MNITLSVDERIAEQARAAAATMGKSLNQAVRDYLEPLAGSQPLALELRAFELSARETQGLGVRVDFDVGGTGHRIRA